jgi:hypothetical protein
MISHLDDKKKTDKREDCYVYMSKIIHRLIHKTCPLKYYTVFHVLTFGILESERSDECIDFTMAKIVKLYCS